MTVPRFVRTAVLTIGLVGACTVPAQDGRAAPWPQRPVVELGFEVADDLGSVTGREVVVFTPDAEVCELVFRLWANKPTTVDDGTSTVLTGATVDGAPVTPRLEPAGAPDGAPGTLAELPLPACVPAGNPIRAELEFTVALGEDSDERVGHAPGAEVAWLATAFPMLAWVRGEGWVRDDAVEMAGETVTSEDFRLAALDVTAPERYAVLGTGTPGDTRPGAAPGTVTHRFTAAAVRDVSVAVGAFDVVERDAGGTRLHVGVPRSGSRVDAAGWADELAEQLGRLEEILGPHPYPHLWAAVLPPLADGVEFPTALLFGDVGERTIPALAAHELAHQWVYALVGNNQARHPWIDEAFATYAQARAAGQEDFYSLDDVRGRVEGELGEPMEYWARTGGFGRYVRGVYDQGAAVLLEGRRRAGEDRFDEALRGYLDANAHRVAGPGDVEAAFAGVPEVLELLREYGALPPGA
ncbi:MAG: M1 family aminopeptidase [Pseudonocardia sp.]